MKVLLIHNLYLERGGEDTVVAQELSLLLGRGHEVVPAYFNNAEIKTPLDRARAAFRVSHSRAAAEALQTMAEKFRPDVAHVHNFFPLVTPGAIGALAECGVPIVQTLHNFRVVCPGGLLMRNGQPCEDCLGTSRRAALRWRCYRDSTAGSAAVAYMGRTFRRMAERNREFVTLVALTRFAKSRFVADGFDEDQVVVRPNFAPDIGAGPEKRGPRLLYVGRLSHEKGAETVVRAAAAVDGIVEIVGDGPETARLRAMASPNVIFAGRISREEVGSKLRNAAAVLVPSRWYEGFPMIVAEAMAAGTPILAARIGSLAEIVEDRETGWLLPIDDIQAWAHAMRSVLTDPEQLVRWGQKARRTYESLYNEESGYRSLIEIYQRAIKQREVSLRQ